MIIVLKWKHISGLRKTRKQLKGLMNLMLAGPQFRLRFCLRSL